MKVKDHYVIVHGKCMEDVLQRCEMPYIYIYIYLHRNGKVMLGLIDRSPESFKEEELSEDDEPFDPFAPLPTTAKVHVIS